MNFRHNGYFKFVNNRLVIAERICIDCTIIETPVNIINETWINQ